MEEKEEEVAKEVEEEVEIEEVEEVVVEAEEEMEKEELPHKDLMLMETQSNQLTEPEEIMEPVKKETERTVLEEVEEITRETVTEEETSELTKPLLTSKRGQTLKLQLLKNPRLLRKKRSQNQSQLSWKPSVSQSMTSFQERPRPKRKMLDKLRVLKLR